MELNDLKLTWKEIESPTPKENNLDAEIWAVKAQQNYRSKMKKIILPEIAGTLVCLVAAAYIGFNFTQLDTTLLQAAGVLSILLLLLLPVISTISTWQLRQVSNVSQPYAETLQSFAMQKIRFIRLQKINITLSYLLLVTTIVLLSKLLNGNDISNNKYYWLFSFTIGFILLLFYSKWVEKFYAKSLQQAEELLKELTV